MLKHTDLTSNRIANFVKYDLEEAMLGERQTLEIEFCPVAHADEKAAAKGTYEAVSEGFRYGPAYRTVWFRISGTVPKCFAGEEVGAILEVGSERTVWRNNSPWQGVDGPHTVCPMFDAAQGGEKVKLYVQAYTGNPQCRVAHRELPREQLVEEVKKAELVVINRAVADLYYDCEFSFDLLKSLPKEDPSYHLLLRTLNECANLFRRGDTERMARCRKLIKDALGAIPGEQKHTIIPVGHAHLDTAWLWPLEITHKKMAHTTANQLRLMEKYPEHVFAHSQASQYEWLEQEYPALFEEVKAAIARGQWEPVGSMWVEADCNLTGGESLIRQFYYGRRYFREKLGYQTDDMWLPDVFGYSAALPQILNKLGIKYFLTQKMSWNQFNKFPHNTFWWQGTDGSKIWTHFPPADTYIGDCSPSQMLESVKKHRDHGRSDMSLYAFGWGDGGGGPTEMHLERLRRARLAGGMPEVAMGRKALDFFREAKGKGADLMTWAGELYFEYHRGTYTSQAATKKGNRVSEFLMRDAEWLSCFTPDFPKAYPAKDLEKAWKLTLLNQFHDIIPGSSVNEVYVDAARDYAIVAEIGERIVRDSLAKISKGFDTRGMERPVALFHNATVPGLALMPWPEAEAPASITVNEESLPVQLTEFEGKPVLAFATPQPALQAVAVGDFSQRPPTVRYRLRASNRKIENGELAVKFDAHGNITSIESLEDGTEFIEPGKLANLFQIFEDKPLFWSAWDVDAFALETGKDLVRSDSFEIIERGPVRVTAQVIKKFGKSTITQRISLGPTPGIRFETEVDWHEEDKMLKVAFPVNVHSSRATYEIQFGHVERPTHYNTSWDMARFEVCAQKWVDLSEADQGVALLNDCKYGHDVHQNVMRQTLLRSPKAPDPECDMGRHFFTYVLMPHFGPLNYAGVVAQAYALNAPVRTVELGSGGGANGSLPPLLSCDDRNVVVETVKKAEDSNDLLVRLYECHNARGRAELGCVKTIKRAWLCDLEERERQELEIADGVVLFDYKPFEIITIKLGV